MPLTDLQARKAIPGDRDYKLTDSGGLHLFVTKAGHKSWRLKYRFAGKEKRLLLGPYPEVSLARARELRDDARRLLREDRDPLLEQRKRRMAAHAAAGATFARYAALWQAAQERRWSAVHVRKTRQALERDVIPHIGSLPLIDIDAPLVLEVLRKVERRGAIDTAKRIRQHISAIYQFAMAEGVVGADPAAGVGRALLPTPPGGRQPAVRTLAEARELLASMDASTSDPATKLASRLLALTAARPGMIRAARWTEFEGIDWDDPRGAAPAALWRVPAERMKLEQADKADGAFEHEMPLAAASVDVLRQVRRLTGHFPHLFVSRRSPRSPMSENTLNYMYARNGYSGRHVPHGWRSTFSTVMNERAVATRRPDDRAIIDGMLAHRPKGVSESEMAYNRALHRDRRREIAEEWAELLMAELEPAARLLGPRTR